MTSTRDVLAALERRIEEAERLLVATDFDGTLCPIVSSPERANLSPFMADLLCRLDSMPGVVVALISGRRLSDLTRRAPAGLIAAGNHGLEIAGSGIEFEHPAARRLWPELQEICAALRARLAEWPGAWVEDKRLTATVHFRNVAASEHSSLRVAVRRSIGSRPFAIRAGLKALEVRPRVDWDKGSALDYVASQKGPFDTIFCLGDDRTDECMFRRNAAGLNVRVGPCASTAACFRVADPGEVAFLFERVAARWSEKRFARVHAAVPPGA